MNKFLSVAVGALAFVAATLQPAHAATVSLDYTLPTEAFDMPAGDEIKGLVQENIVGTDGVNYYYRSPFENTSLADKKFTAVRKDASVSYDVGGLSNKVGFTWGSVDSFNMVKFYAGDVVVDWVSGATLLLQGATQGLGFVQVMLMTDFAFDRIEFSSYNNSFEIANLKISAVPLPAALPLYGAGVFLLGFLGWRRAKARS